jgi:CheY-specific phosphatase CheX
MPAGPKQKSDARDPVTLVVIVGMVGLTLGGIVAIFSAPLSALLGR